MHRSPAGCKLQHPLLLPIFGECELNQSVLILPDSCIHLLSLFHYSENCCYSLSPLTSLSLHVLAICSILSQRPHFVLQLTYIFVWKKKKKRKAFHAGCLLSHPSTTARENKAQNFLHSFLGEGDFLTLQQIRSTECRQNSTFNGAVACGHRNHHLILPSWPIELCTSVPAFSTPFQGPSIGTSFYTSSHLCLNLPW